MKKFCPNCEKITEQSLNHKNEKYKIRSCEVKVKSEYYCCSNCRGEYAETVQMTKTLLAGYAEYRKEMNITLVTITGSTFHPFLY